MSINQLRNYDKTLSNSLEKGAEVEYELLAIIEHFCEREENPYAAHYARMLMEQRDDARERVACEIIALLKRLQDEKLRFEAIHPDDAALFRENADLEEEAQQEQGPKNFAGWS